MEKARKNLESFLKELDRLPDDNCDKVGPVYIYVGFPENKHKFYYAYAGNEDDVKYSFKELWG